MLATMMMHDVADRPPGFGGQAMFPAPHVQPLYVGGPVGMPPQFQERPHVLTDAPLRMHRTLEESAAARKADTGPSWNSRQFRRPPQWRGQQLRNPAPGYPVVPHSDAPGATAMGNPSLLGSALQAMRPGNSVLGVKRKNQKRNNRYKKQKRVEGGEGGPALRGLEDGEFRPPRLKELRRQNKKHTRKFFPRPPSLKKKGKQNVMPDAPRNTTSYIMRASKLGLDATVASPATPSVLRTPVMSPSPWLSGTAGEQLVEAAKELCVDPYGSMNGCIRLRTPDMEESGDSDVAVDKEVSTAESEGTTSSDSAEQVHQMHDQPVNNVQQLDERMDHGLRRFEMLYSADAADHGGTKNGDRFLQTRIEEQENQISHLEEENLTLREKLYLAEQELKELKRRSGDISEDHAEMDGAWSAGEEASCAAAVSRATSVDAC